MKKPCVDDSVRLKFDIPDLELHRGEVGVVRSTWFAPAMTYEVEFCLQDRSERIRALLDAEQIEVEEAGRSGIDPIPPDATPSLKFHF